MTWISCVVCGGCQAQFTRGVPSSLTPQVTPNSSKVVVGRLPIIKLGALARRQHVAGVRGETHRQTGPDLETTVML